jgi:hypothetical protein
MLHAMMSITLIIIDFIALDDADTDIGARCCSCTGHKGVTGLPYTWTRMAMPRQVWSTDHSKKCGTERHIVAEWIQEFY